MTRIAQRYTVPSQHSHRDIMTTTGYDQDFHQWTEDQARLLRGGHYASLDIDHLVDETAAEIMETEHFPN
jgi:hypothetical protein